MRSYQFSVGDGKFYMPYVDAFRMSLKKLPKGEYVLLVKLIEENRTKNQNATYWLWLTVIADETGHNPEEIHEYLKHKFLLCHDKKYPYVRSTTKLTTKEFSEYMQRIETWATEELNVSLPDPNLHGLQEPHEEN